MIFTPLSHLIPPVAPRATLAIVKLTHDRARYAGTCVRARISRCIRGVQVRVPYAAHEHKLVLSSHVHTCSTCIRCIYNFFSSSSLSLSFSLFRSLSLSPLLSVRTRSLRSLLLYSVASFSLDLRFSLFRPLSHRRLPLSSSGSLSQVLVPRKRGSSFSFSFETCQSPPGHALHPRRTPLILLPSVRHKPSSPIHPFFSTCLSTTQHPYEPGRTGQRAFFALSRFCKNMRTLIRWANSFSVVVLLRQPAPSESSRGPSINWYPVAFPVRCP